MQSVVLLLKALHPDRRAVTALEYGLIAAVLVVTVVTGFSLLGTSVGNEFNNIAAELT